MLIDGKRLAEEILAGVGDSLRGKKLGIVVNEGDAATTSFIKIKERAALRLGVKVLWGQGVRELGECEAIVVQLPHPQAQELLVQLPPEKDVDALGPAPLVRAPVAEAVSAILTHAGVAARGKMAVVVGEGRLVGAPVAALLRELGAEVHVISLERGSLEELRHADIVVSGAGHPGLIKPEMLKAGVVLIDAGTSDLSAQTGQAGRVVGDCDPECAKVASVFTPVPGGVGPIAVALLFKNFQILTKTARPGQ